MALVIFNLTVEDNLSSNLISSEPYENVDAAKKAAKKFMEDLGTKWPEFCRWESVGKGHWAVDTGPWLFRIVKQKIKE